MIINGLEPSENVIDARSCDFADVSTGELVCVNAVKGDLGVHLFEVHYSRDPMDALFLMAAFLAFAIITLHRQQRKRREEVIALARRVVPHL